MEKNLMKLNEAFVGRRVAIIDVVREEKRFEVISNIKFGDYIEFEGYPTKTYLSSDTDWIRFSRMESATIHPDEVECYIVKSKK